MASRKYSTISIDTTLASSINSSATTMTVAAGTGTTLMGGVSLTAGDTFALAIDPDTSSEEIVYVTAVSTDTLTVTRAQASTGAIAHNTGATVQHVFTGNDAQHFEDGINSGVTETGTQTLSNKTLTAPVINNPRIKSPEEATLVTAVAATGTVNLDANTQADLYYTTNASGNWVLNVRGDGTTTLASMLGTGDSITVAFKATQGTTAYYMTSLTIDGTVTGVTTKWQGGLTPVAGNPSAVDVYTFNIVKTAATPTYTVFANQSKFV
jgi:hypothetical protein